MLPISSIAAQDLLIQRGGRVVLNVPELVVGNSACTAIVGPNGAGKSLLVKTLCALLKPDQGCVNWGASSPDLPRRFKVGLLLQRPVLLNRSALKNITYALQASGLDADEASIRANEALQAAGLGALIDISAHRLSGGEQQRLALARALAVKPDMLFLDEATANVDPASTQAIEEQLRQAIKDGLTVVFVSHDMGQVKRLADEVILMHHGNVIEQSLRSEFFEHTDNPISRSWLAGEILL